MEDSEHRLDGNVAAGALGEMFSFDISTTWMRCAGCGSMDEGGTEVVYLDAPGMTMRCLHCDTVLLRVATDGKRYWLDLSGIACLQIDADTLRR